MSASSGAGDGGATCSACGRPLAPDHTGPCPHCGKTGKTYSVGMAGEVDFAGSVTPRKTVHVGIAGDVDFAGKVTWKKIREYWEEDRPKKIAWAVTVALLLGVLGAVAGVLLRLGLLASILLAVALALLGVVLSPVVYKVREIEHGG